MIDYHSQHFPVLTSAHFICIPQQLEQTIPDQSIFYFPFPQGLHPDLAWSLKGGMPFEWRMNQLPFVIPTTLEKTGK